MVSKMRVKIGRTSNRLSNRFTQPTPMMRQVTTVNNRYSSMMPYLNTLLRASPSKRKQLLKSFPVKVVDSLSSVINRVVKGQIPMRNKNKLMTHKNKLLTLLHSRDKRKWMYNQKGGFLGMLASIAIPAVASLISNLAS